MRAPIPSLRGLQALLLASGSAALLAPSAFFDAKCRLVRRTCVWVGVFGALVGLGTPVYSQFFHRLPLVDRFRSPGRMLVIAGLALAVLAAIGLDAVLTERRRATRLTQATAVWVTAVAVFLLAPGLARADAAASVGMVAIAATTSLAAALPSRRARSVLAVLLVAIVATTRFAQPGNTAPMPQHYPSSFFRPPRFVAFLRERADGGRSLVVKSRNVIFPLMAKAGSLFGFDVVQDYEPLAPRIYWDLRSAFGVTNEGWEFFVDLDAARWESTWRAYDLMSTRYVIVQAGLSWGSPPERFRLVYEDVDVQIFENLRSLPRAYLVEDSEIIENEDAALARLTEASFDPRTTVVLAERASWKASSLEAAREARVALRSVSAEELVVRVTNPRRSLLVLTDLYYPGWEVRVDDRPRRLLRANVLFRAVALEPGSHEVRFLYVPRTVYAGMAVSAATSVFVVVVTALTWRRRRGRAAGACAIGATSRHNCGASSLR